MRRLIKALKANFEDSQDSRIKEDYINSMRAKIKDLLI
jgi:hypothetical protein